MAFFSGSRRSSLLPTSTSSSSSTANSTHPRSPRSKPFLRLRRRSLPSYFGLSPSAFLLLLGLSLSLLLFLFLLLRFPFPNPLSKSLPSSSSSKSHSKSHSNSGSFPDSHSSKPRLTRRPNIRRPYSGADADVRDRADFVSANVDITTKDLYDRIEFLDIDGGPWKQGWQVNYKGNEWDHGKLKIFVVPHSHNDPGWKLTVEEYYERQSKHILDTIVQALSKDARRKFIWEEMSYLQRWWKDASRGKKEDMTRLIVNGQLEVVGGGWVMNDEVRFRLL